MKNSKVHEVFNRAKVQIDAHWKLCLDAGLEGHTSEFTRRVDDALKEYFDDLSDIQAGEPRVPILASMRELFKKLDGINEEAGGALLETDEREILVEVIIGGAEAAGLELDDYEDGDPTLPFRNF